MNLDIENKHWLKDLHEQKKNKLKDLSVLKIPKIDSKNTFDSDNLCKMAYKDPKQVHNVMSLDEWMCNEKRKLLQVKKN